MARLFFISESNIENNEVIFTDVDSKHLKSLRKKIGDDINCLIEGKLELLVKLISDKIPYKGIILQAKELKSSDNIKVHLIQGIPKLDKMELIIQKLSELGIYEILPVYTRNSDIKGSISENKLDRWNKIAREASIQSGRKDILKIEEPINLDDLLKSRKHDLLSASSLNIVAYEEEESLNLRVLFKNVALDELQDIYFFIGPEGGIHKDEIEFMSLYNFKSIKLKGNILRTETAAVILSGILQYILNYI